MSPPTSHCSLNSFLADISPRQAPLPIWPSYSSTCPLRNSWMASSRLQTVPLGHFFLAPSSDSCTTHGPAFLTVHRANFGHRLYGCAVHQTWRYFVSAPNHGVLSRAWVRVSSRPYHFPALTNIVPADILDHVGVSLVSFHLH